MNTQERILDINSLSTFNDNEVSQEQSSSLPNYFKSIEYYLIIHLTNEELYYLDDETETTYTNSADDVEDTKKGRVYLWK
jgi:hypothetical protein